MRHAIEPSHETPPPEPLLRGALVILGTGVLLGALFNGIGLQSEPPRGLPWIGEDRLALLAEGPLVRATPASEALRDYRTDIDDPLAIEGPAAETALPEIPDVGRPVAIELGALRQLVEFDAALIVDAREADEFERGHIRGAIHLPYAVGGADPHRVRELVEQQRPIVTYCGGEPCEVSLSLAEQLIAAGGRRVAVFVDGYPRWAEAGLPLGFGADESRSRQ